MKRTTILSVVTLLVVATVSLGIAEQDNDKEKPKLDVLIQIQKASYQKGEPIPLKIVLTNTHNEELIIEVPGISSKTDWDEKAIITHLRIIGPGNKDIVPKLTMDTPPISLEIRSATGRSQQVVPVVVLKPQEKLTINIPDISKYFSLKETGKYSVTLELSMAKHDSFLTHVSHPNKTLSKIGEAKWAGALKSNTVDFDINLTGAQTEIHDARPDTREAGIKRANENLSKIAETLIAVVEDEKRTAEEKRKAILLLGKIRDKQSLDFLISNVSMHIPKMKLLGGEALLETPCMYALYTGDWNTAKAVLDSLEKPKSKEDLLRLSAVLESALTRDHAQAIVDVELAKLIASVNHRKENLKVIKGFLK